MVILIKMKEIKAIVKPFKVNDILNQLLESGYPNLTVTLAEGTGSFQGDETSFSTNFSITNSKVAKIVIVSDDAEVDKIIGIICSIAHTGNPGDGIIYVTKVEKTFSIRTGMVNK